MKKILKQNQKGQAIFEFIIFIPFLVFLFTIFYTVGNAINGGIDQQKAVRGYFYHLVKGNSYLITEDDLSSLRNEHSISRVGFFSIGWRESGTNVSQFAPCFKFSSMLRGASDEECSQSTRPTEGSSAFVRIFTAYGVCGPTYLYDKQATGKYAPFQILQSMQTSRACILSNDEAE